MTTAEPADRLLTPYYHLSGKSPRYYQEIAINRAVQAVLQGKHRVLLTLATGTGKTIVAFQICWKLWNSRWNRTGEYRRPRILYLADRNVLVDEPKDKIFAPFGDARHKIEGEAVKSREMYFAIYQAIAERRTPARTLPGIPPRLLRSHRRGRVPPGQRQGREQLARDSRLFRGRLPARHDGHAAPPGQPRHLPLFRESHLYLQPSAGH